MRGSLKSAVVIARGMGFIRIGTEWCARETNRSGWCAAMALLNFVKGTNRARPSSWSATRSSWAATPDCTVVLNVPAVSREHAVIRRIQGKFYIEDLKSRNGTFVNNKEVTARTLLKDNDKIKICDNLLAFYESRPSRRSRRT